MATPRDDQDVLEPGHEILFSTRWFIDYPDGFINPFMPLRLGPLPKSGPAPGTARAGIVSKVATDRAVMVKVTSGKQRGRKCWVPLARVIGKTGERYGVPDVDALEWTDAERAYRQRELKRQFA